ncbi:hypothetical protein GCM10009715_21060 [Paeniglutamicibacter psychrophenolicus]
MTRAMPIQAERTMRTGSGKSCSIAAGVLLEFLVVLDEEFEARGLRVVVFLSPCEEVRGAMALGYRPRAPEP